MFKFLERMEDYSRLPLRLGLGALFLYTGVVKLLWFSVWVNAFTSFGLTFPSPAMWVAICMVAEIIGGALLILGLLTRVAAAWLTVVLIVAAIVWAPYQANPLLDVLKHLAWIGGTFALVMGGPGKWSIDYKLLLE